MRRNLTIGGVALAACVGLGVIYLAGGAGEAPPTLGEVAFVDDGTGPFYVEDITGPSKGQTLCYR